MSDKPFFTEDGVLTIFAETNGDFEMSARMLSAKVAPLQGLAEGYRINLNNQAEENKRLNNQVRTLGEQVEDAKLTIAELNKTLNEKIIYYTSENARLANWHREQAEEIARLKEENEILIATLRIIDRAEWTSSVFNQDHPESPCSLLKENEELRATIDIARDALLKLIGDTKRHLKGKK